LDISIVIPVYNGEETLDRCLQAVTTLDIPEGCNLEILLVNDGSTDRTLDIVADYPSVKIIDLKKNMGRIFARKTGAENAKYDNILFIDSRVKAESDLVVRIAEINYQPLLAGGIKHEKYRSDYDTFFYLIRRKIYFPYFPQSSFSKELYIDEKNFFKAPKGTTCFFVNKDLFLMSLPGTESKDTSDDTKIMHSIVFKSGKKILRHTDLVIEYNQRTGGNINSWIFHRGKIWADYYLSFINRYSVLFFLLTIVILFLLLTNFCKFFIVIVLLLFLSSLYLAENLKDFVITAKVLPLLSALFYSGSILKIISKFSKLIGVRK